MSSLRKGNPRGTKRQTDSGGSSTAHQSKKARAGKFSTDGEGKSSRNECSLVILTKKFVNLLREQDGVLELNETSKQLGIQKRRIYDITNILEGVGLIQKKDKNRIEWTDMGYKQLNTTVEAAEQNQRSSRTRMLLQDVEKLRREESEVEKKIQGCQERLRLLAEDEKNQKFIYLTDEEIQTLPQFQDEILIAIKAPESTVLEVPDEGDPYGNDVATSSMSPATKNKYQIWLESQQGPIEIRVIGQGGINTHQSRIKLIETETPREDAASSVMIPVPMVTQAVGFVPFNA